MIGSLRGRLLARSITDEILVEVQGIGYRVQATASTAANLGPQNSEVFVYIHHVVREDAELLYGFVSEDERRTFEVLLSAPRVGPALALAILNMHRPDVLRKAVAVDDVDALCQVPGIGKKTAVRLLVELKSKLDLPEAEVPPGTDAGVAQAQDSDSADVRAALGSLGYSTQEIRQVMTEMTATGSSEELLREALRLLGGGFRKDG